MIVAPEPAEVRAWVRAERRRGRRIAFVPTMGALHEGHLRLVDRARELGDAVVMSIFVNPLQFGPGEDFERYPRDLARDRALAEARGVDLLFAPDARHVYPEPPVVRVSAGTLGAEFEGAVRPGHFDGVLTVVAKLFHLVTPDAAVFGRKDFQQAVLVRRLAADLDFPVSVHVAPTVRELDGLALSSRNAYLSTDERRQATALSRALRAAEQAWRGGAADPAAVERKAAEVLGAAGLTPDYAAVVDADCRRETQVRAQSVALVAARVGRTRLLDNVVLGDGVGADPVARPA